MSSTTLKKPVVLLVEDDPETQTLMKLVLRKSYEVLVAGNGEEARMELRQHHREVRLIVMDLMLPGSEDGLMLTRYLRSQERWSKIPIIAATARALPEDQLEAYAAGCDDYLAKPFYPRQILDAIDHQLHRGH